MVEGMGVDIGRIGEFCVLCSCYVGLYGRFGLVLAILGSCRLLWWKLSRLLNSVFVCLLRREKHLSGSMLLLACFRIELSPRGTHRSSAYDDEIDMFDLSRFLNVLLVVIS